MRYVLIFSILTTSLSVAAAEEPVVFGDPNLKAAVERALRVSDPTPTNMLELIDLEALNRSISDLTGIEYALNLGQLSLNENQISDISPLEGLTNLTSLGLSTNQISDISPLEGLTNLTSLGLSTNQISDLSPLAGLTNLRWLLLSNNQISDLSPLAGLTNLTELYLDNNRIIDLSPLVGLTSLGLPLMREDDSGVLDLSSNQISDISPLTELPYLSILYLRNNQISDISPLTELSELHQVYLQGNPLSCTTHCETIPAIIDGRPLHFLFVRDPTPAHCNCYSGDLVVFADLTLRSIIARTLGTLDPTYTDMLWLTGLNAGWSRIVDLTGLEHAPNLEWLLLSNNQIIDISPLEGLTNLQSLRIEDNPLDCIAHCITMPLIEENNPEIDLSHDPMPERCDCDSSTPFLRGNANDDDNTDLSDAVFVLSFLFLGGTAPSCADAADTDDSGVLDITDAVYLLSYLFLGGHAPKQPYLTCGLDPTPDDLTCFSSEACDEP